MRGTSLSSGTIWTLWLIVMSGPTIAYAGHEAIGITIWLAGVALQWILGLTVLVRRRNTFASK